MPPKRQSQFLYYDEAVKINFPLFNHTQGDTTQYTTRLVGADSLQEFGLAKSLSVMPGDTIRTWVFAKYLDTDDNNWTTTLSDFIAMLAGGSAPPGTYVDGGFMGTTGGQIPLHAGELNDDKAGETGNAPMAFLNWLVFDRDYNFLDGGLQTNLLKAPERMVPVLPSTAWHGFSIGNNSARICLYLPEQRQPGSSGSLF